MTGKDRNKTRILAVALMFVFFLGGQFLSNKVLEQRKAAAANDYPFSRDVYLLDTYCSVATYAGGGQEALSVAVDALNDYDALLNFSREESDIYKINHRSGDKVEISADTEEILMLMRDFCEETEGKLEPTIRPVTELWNFKEEDAKAPDEKTVQAALKNVKSMQWDVQDGTFTAYDPAVRVDVGSVAKGYIADKIKDVMIANGVTSGIVNLGGNVVCIGHKPDGSPFSIAVADPNSADGYSMVLELDDKAAVTAGAYQRFFIEDGKRYHHIIDPATGYPAQTGLESVTIVGGDSGVCDALSTSLFIMGEQAGKAFLEKYNKQHGSDYTAYFLQEEA